MGFFSELKEDIANSVTDTGNEQEAAAVDTETDDLDIQELLDNLDEGPKTSSYSAPVSYAESKPLAPVSNENAVITKGMCINGDIDSTGSLEVLGSVRGNITISGKLNVVGSIEGNSKTAEFYAEGAQVTGEVNATGSVKIGQSSVIIGNIFATSAVIAGAVKGDIDVKGPVILDTSAIVMGNIKSKSVQINNGAVIEGVCSQCYADVSPTTFFDDVFKKAKK